MKLNIKYDQGDGEKVKRITPAAIVGWETRNKRKVSDLGDGMGVTDLVNLLLEQLKVEGETPGTTADFAKTLVDIDPEVETPTLPAPGQ